MNAILVNIKHVDMYTLTLPVAFFPSYLPYPMEFGNKYSRFFSYPAQATFLINYTEFHVVFAL